MKVGTSAVTQQQAAKTNKRPQLALDAAFKHTRSGIQVYVERPGHGDKTKDGSHIKVHYEAGWLRITKCLTAAGLSVVLLNLTSEKVV